MGLSQNREPPNVLFFWCPFSLGETSLDQAEQFLEGFSIGLVLEGMKGTRLPLRSHAPDISDPDANQSRFDLLFASTFGSGSRIGTYGTLITGNKD